MVEYHITSMNNFMRIFKIPKKFPEGFCFNGPREAIFLLVDWFNPFIPSDIYINDSISKSISGEELEKHHNMIKKFIKRKTYYDSNFNYLALTDYGDVFLI